MTAWKPDNVETVPPDRRERFRDWLVKEGLRGAVLLGVSHSLYFARYWRYAHVPNAVIFPVDGPLELVVSFDEAEVATAISSADIVSTYGERGFGLDPDSVRTLVAAVSGRASRLFGSCPIAYGSELGNYASAFGQPRDCGRAIAELRQVKDSDERRLVGRAFALALAAQRAVSDRIAAGASEIELFSTAQHAAQVLAGAPIEYASDLLAGARSAQVCWPVAVAGATPVRDGDVVISDISVRAGGYWGDSSRTLVCGSDAEATEILDALNQILDEGASKLVPGSTGHELHAWLRRTLETTFPRGEFPHHGGHGLGIDAVERPRLIPNDHLPLESGMLVALEPGIYFPGRFGLRVENVYEVRSEGRAILVDASVEAD